MYVQRGTMKLSVFSKLGREGVVAVLKSGDFFGEECLADEPTRMKNATAITRSVVLVITKADMVRLLRTHQALSDRFLAHMLVREIRLEEDLVDHHVNSAEQRLARKLLLLARIGNRTTRSKRIVPRISQSTLAGMVGITRSRVSLLLNRFSRLGYIDTSDGLRVNRSLRRAFGNGAVVKPLAIANGDGLTTLVQAGGFARPTWSPDGSTIAFSSRACRDCAGSLRYVSTDGTKSGLIFSNGHSPAWRP